MAFVAAFKRKHYSASKQTPNYQEFQLNVSMNTTVTAMAAFVTTDSDCNYKMEGPKIKLTNFFIKRFGGHKSFLWDR